MKNFFIFLLIVAIIGAMGYGAYKYLFDYEQTYIDDVVSEGALFYVKASDVKDNIERIGATKLWKEISGIDYESLMKEAGADTEKIKMVELIFSRLGSRGVQDILKYFFNDEVAFVIYPSEIDLSKLADFAEETFVEIIVNFLSNVSIVLRVGAEVQFADTMSQLFNSFGAKVGRQQLKYNGHTIYVINVPSIGLGINYAKIDDLIIAGIGDIAAKRSYDILDGKIPPLSSDARFTQASKKFHIDSDLDMFLNLHKLTGILRDQAKSVVLLLGQNVRNTNKDEGESDTVKIDPKKINAIQKNVDEYFKQIAGFDSVVVSTKWEGIYESSFLVFFDQAQLPDELAKAYSCPASKNQSIDFIPEDAIFYQWSNCLDLADIWDQMSKEMGKFPDAEAKLAQVAAIEQSFGLSIKNDIVPTFAGEFGGYLQGFNLDFLFPVPELLLFIETKDRVKAINVIERLTQNPMLELRPEEHAGIRFNYFVTPFGEALEPGYCFIGNHLLVSGSKNILKKAIDAHNETALSLASNPGFRSVNIGLTDLNRGIQFVALGKFVKEIRSVIKWVNKKSVVKDEKKLAFKRGAEMKLADTRSNIESLKDEIAVLEDDYVVIEDEVWNIESIGQDVSAKRAELKDVRQKLKDKKNDLKILADQVNNLQKTVDEFGRGSVSPEFKKQIVDKAVFPILNGSESISAVGSRLTIDQVEGVVEANMYIDISE